MVVEAVYNCRLRDEIEVQPNSVLSVVVALRHSPEQPCPLAAQQIAVAIQVAVGEHQQAVAAHLQAVEAHLKARL